MFIFVKSTNCRVEHLSTATQIFINSIVKSGEVSDYRLDYPMYFLFFKYVIEYYNLLECSFDPTTTTTQYN